MEKSEINIILIRSENLFFDHKDTFLYMTIFISIKTLYSLRKTCKRLNQWLTDPTTFSWKQRIQNTFPNSYEDVLKQTMEDQIARLLKFDSFVEAGHFVCCNKLIRPRMLQNRVLPPRRTSVSQIPWQKHIFVFTLSMYVHLYDSNTASVIGQMLQLDLGNERYAQVLFNIRDRKIGFLTNHTLKLYRHEENNELAFEREIFLNYNFIKLDQSRALEQMYGDCIVVKDRAKYLFHSISSNSVIFELDLQDFRCKEQLSKLTPLAYIIYSTYDGQHRQHYIKEVNFLTRQSKDPIPIELDMDCSIDDIHLIEGDAYKYLKIHGSGYGFSAQLYDLQHNKAIVNQFYDPDEMDAELIEINSLKWRSAKYSTDLRYYYTKSNGELRINEFNESILSHDNSEEIFSKKFEQQIIHDRTIKWLPNGVLTGRVHQQIDKSKPDYVTQVIENQYVFISATKKQVIGFLDGDLQVFSNGDKTIAFNLSEAIAYSIIFTANSSLKRKLEDPDASEASKRRKLDKE